MGRLLSFELIDEEMGIALSIFFFLIKSLYSFIPNWDFLIRHAWQNAVFLRLATVRFLPNRYRSAFLPMKCYLAETVPKSFGSGSILTVGKYFRRLYRIHTESLNWVLVNLRFKRKTSLIVGFHVRVTMATNFQTV